MKQWKISLRRLNTVLHRDLGYFFSGLIIIYCISGLALNHIDDWNPDFIVSRETISLPKNYSHININDDLIDEFDSLVGQKSHRVYDFPTSDQIKIYYENATFHIFLDRQSGVYEKISRRSVFYESNLLHKNSVKGWKWASDVFAVLLIVVAVTGLFMVKGRFGFGNRGKWFLLAGMLPPVFAIVLFELLQ